VDDNILREAYRSCDIFVAPSRFESFGLVFLEAMREAKPVVGCDAGGMSEIIVDNVTGRLVPPGDEQALSLALSALIDSEELRRTMGEAGRNHFLEKFTSSCVADASSQLFDLAQQNFRELRA
jgi:hypothetical protein